MIWWYLVRCGCASGINVVNLRAFYAREVIGYVLPLPELPWGFNRVFKYIGFYAVGEFSWRGEKQGLWTER